jgi:hypothetical protein
MEILSYPERWPVSQCVLVLERLGSVVIRSAVDMGGGGGLDTQLTGLA